MHKVRTSLLNFPFPVVLFPLFSFYNSNIQELHPGMLILPSICICIFSIVLYLIFKKLFKNIHKVSASTVATFVLFFTFGHLMKILEFEIGPAKTISQSYYFLAAWVLLWFFILLSIRKSSKNFLHISKIVTTAFWAILIFIVFQIGQFELGREPISTLTVSPPKTGKTESTLQDIYYIIAEKYASNSTLKSYFNYDNTDFTDFLKKQGFIIIENAHANYLDTQPSISSSLSMNYLDDVVKKMGINSKDRRPLFRMFTDYKVWRYLKSKGYSFVHVGPYWDVDNTNAFADINYSFKLFGLSDFSRAFLETTILYPILNSINISNPFGLRIYHFNYANDQINKLGEFSKIPGPKFVFAHLYLTHDPYVFDADGSFVSQKKFDEVGYKKMYINTLKYANTKFKTLIETILSHSKTPPIIILQADEGPRSEEFFLNQYIPWTKSTPADFRIKTGILSSFYLPGVTTDILYSSITPVNTFRVIFNHYFNDTFELLPDRTFAHPDYIHPYKFWEITDSVN